MKSRAGERVAAVIQCTAGDLYASRDPDDYCITACRSSGLFDEIVLAVPDVPASDVFHDIARDWDIALYRGAPLNVAARVAGAAASVGTTIAARVLLRQFYLDIQLVSEMIEMLVAGGLDYVSVPRDFNYAIGADVATTAALERVAALPGTDISTAASHFSPWQYMEQHPESFRVAEHPGTPDYPGDKVAAIRAKLATLIAENQVCFDWQFPASAYAFLAPHIRPSDRVLDIACGRGEGSRRLREACAEVVGVDLDAEYVRQNTRSYGDIPGVSFEIGDAETFSAPGQFDAIVSLHTMEHLDRPAEFLARSRENLRPSGTLFLEVPLLMPRPLRQPLFPYHHKEFTVGEVEELIEAAGFETVRAFGKDRHQYVALEKARQAVQLHCSPRA